MIKEQQIKALAELDGWVKDDHMEDGFGGSKLTRLVTGWRDSRGVFFRRLPDYLTSYDAIIPLIQKQSDTVKRKIWAFLPNVYINCLPTQLCEALIRATGKWKN